MNENERARKYQLIASLGRGGMADVFLAVARGPAGFNKLIVIKRLRASLADDEGYRVMFLDEARLAARLNHPNVVHTYEVGEEEGSIFMAMEYLEGQPLHRVVHTSIVQDRPLALALSAHIIADALAGLHYAHELRDYDGSPLNIVHRDVSPHNLFVTYDGQVKLVDFGVAKAESSSAETVAGVLKGKAAYMAPEQAKGARVDRRTDVFAMGIVLWELCVGERLMLRDTNAETIQRLLSEPIPRPSTIVPGFPAELEVVVMRALEHRPDDRYATASEMRDALSAWVAKQPSRPDELAVRMTAMFATTREDIARRVQASMEANPGTGELARIPVSIRDGTETPSSRLVASRAQSDRTRSEPLTLETSAVKSLASSAPSRSAVPQGRSSRAGIWVAMGVAGLVGGLAVALVMALRRPHEGVAGAAGAPPTPAPEAAVEVLLRLHGSNTIGAELAPLLAEAYLKSHNSTEVERRPGESSGQVLVVGKRPGKQDTAIEIAAAGSQTAFEDLAAQRCDIGMSSRPIKPAEAEQLARAKLGDFTSPASEHVLGLDGIAAIVHPNNAVRSLSIEQLRTLFDGEVKDWSQVGGGAGPIVLMARDDKSGTYDTWKHLVMGDAALGTATRFADSDKLSDAVASDPSAIGFIGLAYVRNARALAVSDKDSTALYPSRFTVAAEDYPLSRRLFLYTPARPTKPATLEFVNFALSPAGQKLVSEAGFVDLDVGLRDPEPCVGRCPARYVALSSKARRLSLDFRFRSGSTVLDSRGQRDIDRLLTFFRDRPSPHLFLLGFSDSQGDPAQNLELSRMRARQVAEELAARGLHAQSTLAFGSEMPVASNETDAGRDRNRRVEVWLENQ